MITIDDVVERCGLQPFYLYRRTHGKGTTLQMLCRVVVGCSKGKNCLIVAHSRAFADRLVALVLDLCRQCDVKPTRIEGRSREFTRREDIELFDGNVYQDHY